MSNFQSIECIKKILTLHYSPILSKDLTSVFGLGCNLKYACHKLTPNTALIYNYRRRKLTKQMKPISSLRLNLKGGGSPWLLI
jgi:hypothetical protein